jgi:hypothetical protein
LEFGESAALSFGLSRFRLSHGVEDVTRVVTLCNVLVLICLSACADSPDWVSPVTAPGATLQGSGEVATRGGQALSPEALHVSQIAFRNGDRNFLMLDKARGKIIVFENGAPTFSGAALTGENPADFLAPDAIGKTFAEQKGLKYKVTPAGRYTVSTGYDNAYGETLDINEVLGIDWDIAIHKVWLGAPSEHREARLRSPRDQDKHITYGCIDVDGQTMQQLLARLPDEDGTPLYILPVDRNLITKLFRQREAVREISSPAS